MDNTPKRCERDFEMYIRRMFDSGWYIERNQDVAKAGIDPLEHWFSYGFEEKRLPSPKLLIVDEKPTSNLDNWLAFTWKSKNIWLLETKDEEVGECYLFAPLGHYYSPIVDVSAIKQRKNFDQIKISQIDGIDFRFSRMLSFFLDLSQSFEKYNFTQERKGSLRYFSRNEFFPPGDALVLFATIMMSRPKRIVEVGSGFSTAVILDALDQINDQSATHLTCIEPYPDRLFDVMHENDRAQIDLRSQFVQDVDLSVFTALQANDILFLDTSHVCKTGSDVNFELFTILPLLKPGVLIHFHDIFHGFEYPSQWIFEQNRSWNEQYILRAFLVNNNAYEIIMFNDAFSKVFDNHKEIFDDRFLSNPGGSLWLRKI